MVTSAQESIGKVNRQVNKQRRHFATGRALMVIWGGIAAVILCSFAILTFSSANPSSPAGRIVHLEGEFKCPSCIDLSVAESSAASSISIKTFIKNEVAQGASDAQIKDQLVASYGNSILFTPPKSGAYLVIWILPFGLVLLLGYFSLRPILSRKDWAQSGSGSPNDPRSDDEPPIIEGVSGDLALSMIPLGETINHLPASYGAANHDVAVDGAETRPSQSLMSRALLALLHRSTSTSARKYLAIFGAAFCVAGVGLGLYTFEQGRSQAASRALESRELTQAIDYTYSGQDVSALRLLSLVLHQDPYQPQALAYQGWLLFQAGVKTKSPSLVQKGEQLVLDAIAIQPRYPDAHGFLAMIDLYVYHETAQAKKQFGEFLADSPSSTIRTDLSAAYKAATAAITAKPATTP